MDIANELKEYIDKLPCEQPAVKQCQTMTTNGHWSRLYRCSVCGADVMAYNMRCKCGRLFERPRDIIIMNGQDKIYAMFKEEHGELHFAFGMNVYKSKKTMDSNNIYREHEKKVFTLFCGNINQHGMTLFADKGLKKGKEYILPDLISLNQPTSRFNAEYHLGALEALSEELTEDVPELEKVRKNDNLYSTMVSGIVSIADKDRKTEPTCSGTLLDPEIAGSLDSLRKYIVFVTNSIQKQKDERSAEKFSTGLTEETRKNYPAAKNEIIDSMKINCILAQCMLTPEQTHWHIECTCGYKRDFRASHNAMTHAEVMKLRNELSQSVQSIVAKCPACGVENDTQTIRIPRKKEIVIRYGKSAESVRSSTNRKFITVEKTSLPDDSVLVRYFLSSTWMTTGTIKSTVTETGRCFINDKNAFFYLPADTEKENASWEKVNISTFGNRLGVYSHFICFQEEEVARMLKTSFKDGLKHRVLSFWDCKETGNAKDPIHIPGNANIIFMNMVGPAVSVLNEHGFYRIIKEAKRNHLTRDGLTSVFNQDGKTPAEVLKIPEEALENMTKFIPKEQVRFEDVYNYQEAYQNLSLTEKDAENLFYLARNGIITNAIRANKMGIDIEAYAKYVQTASQMHMTTANNVASVMENVLSFMHDSGRNTTAVLNPASYRLQEAVVEIIGKMQGFFHPNKEFMQEIQLQLLNESSANGETAWFASDEDKKAETFSAFMQRDQFVQDAIYYLSNINRANSITADRLETDECALVQFICKKELTKIVCAFMTKEGIRKKVFEKTG